MKGDWVCLRTSKKALESAGISTTFEATAPVGDIAAFDAGDELFPHVQGGLPASGGVIFEELCVHCNGTRDTRDPRDPQDPRDPRVRLHPRRPQPSPSWSDRAVVLPAEFVVLWC